MNIFVGSLEFLIAQMTIKTNTKLSYSTIMFSIHWSCILRQKLLLLVCFLIFATYQSSAQTAMVDSLNMQLNNTEDPKQKIGILLQLAEIYNMIDQTLAVESGEKALSIARSTNDKKSEGGVLGVLGALHAGMYNGEQSREYSEQAITIFEELENRMGVASALHNIGLSYYRERDYVKAMDYFLRSLAIEEEEAQNPGGLVVSYVNLGVMWSDMRNYEQAEFYVKKAVRHAQEHNIANHLMSAYHNMSYLAINQQKYDEALMYADSTYQLAKESESAYGMAKAETVRADIFMKEGKLEEAYKAINGTLDVYNAIGDSRGIVHNTIIKAQIEEKLGDFEAAKQNFNKALAKAELIDDVELLKMIYESLYQIYKYQGEIDSALVNHERYHLYQDSLVDEQRVKQIASLQIEYESERKERQIRDLEQQNEIQDLKLDQATSNLIISIIIIVLLILLGVGIYLFFKQRNSRLKYKAYEIEQKLLRVQMNPHFIFNALTTIQEYMLNADSTRAGIYLSKFSKLMRQALENSRSEYILLEQEVNMLENYLSLHLLLQSKPFDYSITVDESIDITEVAVPPMFAQPFIENALKHGFNNIDRDGKIDIFIRMEGNQVILEIKDNGVGIKQEVVQEKSGHRSLATQITKERINIFKQIYNKKITFEVSSLKEGTLVKFLLPYQLQ